MRDKKVGKHARWAWRMQEYDFDVQYRSVALNKAADYLSRMEDSEEYWPEKCFSPYEDTTEGPSMEVLRIDTVTPEGEGAERMQLRDEDEEAEMDHGGVPIRRAVNVLLNGNGRGGDPLKEGESVVTVPPSEIRRVYLGHPPTVPTPPPLPTWSYIVSRQQFEEIPRNRAYVLRKEGVFYLNGLYVPKEVRSDLLNAIHYGPPYFHPGKRRC